MDRMDRPMVLPGLHHPRRQQVEFRAIPLGDRVQVGFFRSSTLTRFPVLWRTKCVCPQSLTAYPCALDRLQSQEIQQGVELQVISGDGLGPGGHQPRPLHRVHAPAMGLVAGQAQGPGADDPAQGDFYLAVADYPDSGSLLSRFA